MLDFAASAKSGWIGWGRRNAKAWRHSPYFLKDIMINGPDDKDDTVESTNQDPDGTVNTPSSGGGSNVDSPDGTGGADTSP